MIFAKVAVNVPLSRTFTYMIPRDAEDSAVPGMRVIVPFRNKKMVGYVTEITGTPDTGTNIKEISSLPDSEPVVSKEILKLIHWIAGYYSAPIGEVFAAAMPNLLNSVKEEGKKRKEYEYDFLKLDKENSFQLSASQEQILKEIGLGSEGFKTTLLHGVTGSGKTEIYIRLIDEALKSGGSALLLVPEISLAPQLAGRVAAHFEKNVAVYHSGLTEAGRLSEWKRIKSGDAKIVVGTRSAMFAPLMNLSLIIIDEEHDHSYKQEESPRYHARDSAIMRASIEKIPVVLGSATPSIESLANARAGKYVYLSLPERYKGRAMPEIEIVDMRKEVKSELLNPHISLKLLSELKKTLKAGKQALLFLNRRGFANFLLCRDCGYIPKCPNCNISLTYHRKDAKLTCHYCDYHIKVHDTCPECKGLDLINIGSGTEMIEEFISKELPTARIARLDRDTVTTEKKRRDILAKMHGGKIDILIGTQMITKGHDFPDVTLVGIISADQSIHFPDFRSTERTFQILTQVSGRAGRALHPGKVIIQTYSPEHVAIRSSLAGNIDGFIEEELNVRRELSYPPFSKIANIKFSGNNGERVIQLSKKIGKLIEKQYAGDASFKVLGPAPAPIAMMRGKVRWQILLKSQSAKKLSETLGSINRYLEDSPATGVKVIIDVDPISVM